MHFCSISNMQHIVFENTTFTKLQSFLQRHIPNLEFMIWFINSQIRKSNHFKLSFIKCLIFKRFVTKTWTKMEFEPTTFHLHPLLFLKMPSPNLHASLQNVQKWLLPRVYSFTSQCTLSYQNKKFRKIWNVKIKTSENCEG